MDLSYSKSSSTSLTRQPSTVINLGKPSLRRRLEAYYSLISPQVLENEQEWKEKFDQIYEKFGGTVEGEAELATKLAKKYGDTVQLKLTTNITTTTTSMNDFPANRKRTLPHTGESTVIAVHDELWYCLHPSERNSGIVNFTQHGFDPVAALNVDTDLVYQANPFLSKVSILDNMSKCLSLLPPCDPQSKQQQQGLLQLSHSNKATKTQQKKNNNTKVPVFTAFAAKYENTGPLSFLHQIHIERKRIRVLVRYIDCIRGTLTGYLLAFDKHMNMILRDVDEVYTSRVTRVFENHNLTKAELEWKRRRRQGCISKGGGGSGDGKGSLSDPIFRVYQRHVDQMLVRGDCVVSVWNAESERSA